MKDQLCLEILRHPQLDPEVLSHVHNYGDNVLTVAATNNVIMSEQVWLEILNHPFFERDASTILSQVNNYNKFRG